jgi:hypothetical protein
MDGRTHSAEREWGVIIAPLWCRQDLAFLENTLRRGASFREVAGFLCRAEGEVREKANELGIHTAEEPGAARIKGRAPRGRAGGRKTRYGRSALSSKALA